MYVQQIVSFSFVEDAGAQGKDQGPQSAIRNPLADFPRDLAPFPPNCTVLLHTVGELARLLVNA